MHKVFKCYLKKAGNKVLQTSKTKGRNFPPPRLSLYYPCFWGGRYAEEAPPIFPKARSSPLFYA